MKTICLQTVLLITAALLTTTACTSTTPNTTSTDHLLTEQPTTNESDPKQKKMVDLTEQERNIFNETMHIVLKNNMLTDEAILATCNLEAAFTIGNLLDDATPTKAALHQACAQSRDECIADLTPGTDDEQPNPVADMDIPTACDATFAEFEACIRSMADRYTAIVSQHIACEDQTLESLQAASLQHPFTQLADPIQPACQIVENKCPGAF